MQFKPTCLILVFVFSQLCSYAQNSACDQLDRTDAKLTSLRVKIKQDKSSQTMNDIISASKSAAEFYIACIRGRNDLQAGEILSANYQIGKYYYDAGDCTNALAYFKKCLDLPICATTKFNNGNRTFKDMIQHISSGNTCRKKVGENQNGLKIVTYTKVVFNSGHKNQYTSWVDKKVKELNQTNTLDALPLLSTEIEELDKRIMPLSDSAGALRVAKEVAGTGAQIRIKAPFVIVNVNGKTDDFSYDINNQTLTENKGNESSRYVSREVGSEISVINNALADPLFKDVKFDSFIPVYLYNGGYNQECYNDFLDFCAKVHFRYPGQRIGYYNEYDNSAVIWMPSGYGTFSHELRHVFLHHDFPDIPVWLDEGIASLSEEMDRNGKRLDNWRLVYIKQFEKLRKDYFTIDKIVNYENNSDQQLNTVHDCYSRYLCMFLEENGLLNKFYQNAKAENGKEIDVNAQLKSLFNKEPQQINLDFITWLSGRSIPSKWNADTYVNQVRNNISQIVLNN